MEHITFLTELSPGTKVSVGNKQGEVISVRHAKDQFGMPINVHKIHFTKQFMYRVGNVRKYKFIDKTQEINYASIYIIPNETNS